MSNELNYEISNNERREREREQKLTRTASLSPVLTDFRPISSSESIICRRLCGFCRDMIGSFLSFCFFLLGLEGGGLKSCRKLQLLIICGLIECMFSFGCHEFFMPIIRLVPFPNDDKCTRECYQVACSKQNGSYRKFN